MRRAYSIPIILSVLIIFMGVAQATRFPWVLVDNYLNTSTLYVNGSAIILNNLTVGNYTNITGSANITGNLNVSGNVRVFGNLSGELHHGEFYFDEGLSGGTPATVTITNTTGFFLFANWTSDYHHNGTFLNNTDNTTITNTVGGHYLTDYAISFTNGVGDLVYTSVFVNGMEQYKCNHYSRLGVTGDVADVSGTCILKLLAGDNITLAFRDDTASVDVQVYSANINFAMVNPN